jgi:hypothetical protein
MSNEDSTPFPRLPLWLSSAALTLALITLLIQSYVFRSTAEFKEHVEKQLVRNRMTNEQLSAEQGNRTKEMMAIIIHASNFETLKKNMQKALGGEATPPATAPSIPDPASAPQANSPEDALKMLEDAYHQGDHEAVRNLLPKSERRVYDRMIALTREQGWAIEDMQDALVQRFGPNARFYPADASISSLASWISTDPARRYELVSKKYISETNLELRLRVTLTVNPASGETLTREESLHAFEEPSGWKIGNSNPTLDDKTFVFLRKHIEADLSITAQLKAGIHSTKEEALKAWRALRSENPIKK